MRQLPNPKKSPNMRQKIETALGLSKIICMPFFSGDEQRNNELLRIAKDLECGAKTIRTGTRYDIVLIYSTKEMELI